MKGEKRWGAGVSEPESPGVAPALGFASRPAESAARPSTGMRTYWTIWSGQALSLAGSQASQFGLIWWLTLETGSPAVLSTATFCALLPAVVLGPAIGALVDRWNRRVTMLVADGIGFHIPKGYIYFAMAFACMIEGLNMLVRRAGAKKPAPPTQG